MAGIGPGRYHREPRLVPAIMCVSNILNSFSVLQNQIDIVADVIPNNTTCLGSANGKGPRPVTLRPEIWVGRGDKAHHTIQQATRQPGNQQDVLAS